MATELDLELGPVVVELINEFGKDITFTIGGDNDYDPKTGITDQDGQTTVVVKGSPPAPVRRFFGADAVAREGDSKTFIASSGLTFTPKPGLVVEIDSEKWQVVEVTPIYTGELIAAYGLILRREG